jgi:hypothetical protein
MNVLQGTSRAATLALLAALLLAGCTPLQWARPDTTLEETRSDVEDCQQRAFREAQWRSFASPTWRGGRWRDPFWGSRYYDESWLTRFCMEVRGYELQAVPKDEPR